MDSDQAFLSYYVGDSLVFAFLVNQESKQLIRLQKDSLLVPNIQNFRDLINAWPREKYLSKKDPERLSTERQFAQLGHTLFKNLLAPIFPTCKFPKRLLIIPHGELYYVPFDALLTDSVGHLGSYTQYPFLFKTTSLSYNYSATLWREMHRPKAKKKLKPLLAMALSFPEGPKMSLDRAASVRDTLPQIPYSQVELEGLNERFEGQFYSDSTATQKHFWAQAPNYQVIHLSTHAWLNEENSDFSFVALAPEKAGTNHHKLYVKELYNLQLDADLVVLSACETGLGKLYQGEGMLSVARGFSYAGARSIVNTLWSVNDQATSHLILSFYDHLKDRKPKDLSLQMARQEYLSEVLDEAYAHPYYWAAAIPIGNMEPVSFSNHTRNRYLLLIGICALFLTSLIFFYFWNRRQSV